MLFNLLNHLRLGMFDIFVMFTLLTLLSTLLDSYDITKSL